MKKEIIDMIKYHKQCYDHEIEYAKRNLKRHEKEWSGTQIAGELFNIQDFESRSYALALLLDDILSRIMDEAAGRGVEKMILGRFYIIKIQKEERISYVEEIDFKNMDWDKPTNTTIVFTSFSAFALKLRHKNLADTLSKVVSLAIPECEVSIIFTDSSYFKLDREK